MSFIEASAKIGDKWRVGLGSSIERRPCGRDGLAFLGLKNKASAGLGTAVSRVSCWINDPQIFRAPGARRGAGLDAAPDPLVDACRSWLLLRGGAGVAAQRRGRAVGLQEPLLSDAPLFC